MEDRERYTSEIFVYTVMFGITMFFGLDLGSMMYIYYF